MRRTRKWSFVAQEVQRLVALGLTPYAIAKRLELSPSTVTRWKHAGKLDPESTTAPAKQIRTPIAPAKWAEQARADYDLDSTDGQLVTLAQQALELAYNMAETPAIRLAASARFQALEKRLALRLRNQPEDEAPQKPREREKRSLPARTGTDPRNILQAVK